MDETLRDFHNECQKVFIKDVLKICNHYCPEYINDPLKAFLDGLATNGELPDIVPKSKYDLVVQDNKDIKKLLTIALRDNSKLKKEIKQLKEQNLKLSRNKNKGFLNKFIKY